MWFVLVHSPLLGPRSWSDVAAALEARDHRATVPDLRNGDDWEGELWRAHASTVAAALSPGTGRDAWFVAHSGSGPLLPAIGAVSPFPPAGCIFVDAALPHPGRSRFEALPAPFVDRVQAMATEGRLPPWSDWFPDDLVAEHLPDPSRREAFIADLAPVPVRLFEERMPDVAGWDGVPCAYLQLSAAYDDERRAAEARGWPVRRVDGNHLWPVTHPETVADLIGDLALEAGTAA